MSSAISTDHGLRPWQLFLLAGMLAATAVVLVSSGRSTSSVVVLSVTVVAASLVAVAAYRSLSPLVSAEDLVPDAPAGGRTRAALEREKALVLRSIKEIEFDHAMRKTAAADFEEMRDRLKVRAVGLLRQLDSTGYRDAVERDLAVRAEAGARPVAGGVPRLWSVPVPGPEATPRDCQVCHTPNAPDARFCKACGEGLAAPICAACHTSNESDARFCKGCGVSLGRPA